MKGLTKRQEDVMNILWDAKEPIIASEIVKTGTDLSSIFLTCGLSSGANISPALDGYSDWSSKTKTFTVTSASGTRSQQWTIILN